jgi:membrane-associated phospholipid phosphatase
MNSGPRNRVVSALFPRWTDAVHRRLLAASAACAIGAVAFALFVKATPYLGLDDSIARSIQSVNWGPLTATFPFFSFIGGPGGGIYMQLGVILVVLLLNRRAWLLALAATAGGLWYPLIVGLVNRPRPTLAQVSQITEHPGSTSFPSGHVIYITISVGLLMLCLGYRYLPGWARPIGWAVVAAIVLTAAISRVYVGAHWPIDVFASLLIAGGWLALVTSFSWISDRALTAANHTAPNEQRQLTVVGAANS